MIVLKQPDYRQALGRQIQHRSLFLNEVETTTL